MVGACKFRKKLAERIVLMDPWLDGNHKAVIKTSDVKEANIVCVIHDYMDHVGSAFEICE